MHLAPLIRDLAIILAVAALVTICFRKIRQPVVLGYIIAGIIVGPHTPPFPLVVDIPNIKTLADLGVIFIMFSLGLEFSFRRLARLGPGVLFTAAFELILMWALGYFVGRAFSWSKIQSIFLGSIVSISSTTIIYRALEELGLKARRFSQIVFGILVVEDLAAILMIASFPALASASGLSAGLVLNSLGKLIIVVTAWILGGYVILPRLVRFVGKFRSDEMLVVLSVGLCLLLVVLAAHFEYSVALGAFITGSILAESSESQRIEELLKPIRDLFAAIFFVSVGMLIDPRTIWVHKELVLIVSSVVIFGKIFGNAAGSLISGQTLKRSILIGFSLAQIGEFSFIISGLGLSLGLVNTSFLSVAVAVSVITTFTTPYFLRYSPKVADLVVSKIPERGFLFLQSYSSWIEGISLKLGKAFYGALLRWAISGLVLIIISLVVSKSGIPIFHEYFRDQTLATTLAWIGALIGGSPFIWAMISVSKERRIFFRILTVVWIALVSVIFFPVLYVEVTSIAVCTALFWHFRKLIEKSYHWVEKTFLKVFLETKKSTRERDFYKSFAPWDAHLVRIKVHPDSEISGKRIAEVELRKKFGVNVVAIQRGSKIIVAPNADQQIFPKDELLVLGTDEQVDAARSKFERIVVPLHEEPSQTLVGYDLSSIYLSETSWAAKKSIRQARLREEFGVLVVGIEREGKRILNPDSDLILQSGDLLWVVGENQKIVELQEKLGSS